MDVWIVAAAAGAGYVAQRLKNLTRRGNDKWLDSSPENLTNVRPESPSVKENIKEKSCPFRTVLWTKSLGEEQEREQAFEADSAAEKASTCINKDDNFANCSNSSSLAGFLSNEDVQGDWEHRVPSDIDEVFASDSLPHPSSSEVGFSYGFGRNRSSLRSRRINSQFIKPRTSLESCLMAQLYNEHAEIDEYTYSLLPQQKPTVRPFIVTDGSRIISTALREPFSEPTRKGKCELQNDTRSQEHKTVLGVPRLPNVVSGEVQKKAKSRNRKEQVLRRIGSNNMANRNHNNPQGTSDRALLFYLGLTMGIISSFLANKQEMEKLNKLLKQTQNLVQDLHEEIEMKDSLTVKELEVEDYKSQDVHNDNYFNDAVHVSSIEQNCDEEYNDQKAEEVLLSNIEAELEAELERLESSINSSRLEGKLSKLTKLDPDLVSDVVEGELRYDLFCANTGNQPYADRDGSGNVTPCSINYAVSPRELSLRLHEVIQSRLEERVKELETALQSSQRKVKYVESEHIHPGREELPQNKTGTFSTQEIPIAENGEQSLDEPVTINLSGEALAAYNEAYEEFTKVSESDEEDFPFGFEYDNWVQNGHAEQHSVSNGNPEMIFDRQTEEDLYAMSNDILTCSSRHESEDDEMERLLIRQIVEKAKQGSPAILKAQRELLLTVENEH